MGNYESVRIKIGVSMPLSADRDYKAVVAKAITTASKLVDNSIEDEFLKLLGDEPTT